MLGDLWKGANCRMSLKILGETLCLLGVDDVRNTVAKISNDRAICSY